MRSSSANRLRRRALAAASAMVLLGACGDGGSGGDGSESGDPADSPLSVLFGGGDSTAEARAKQLEQEEAVALCMKENGWEYTPVDWEAQFGNDAGGRRRRAHPEGVRREVRLRHRPQLRAVRTARTSWVRRTRARPLRSSSIRTRSTWRRCHPTSKSSTKPTCTANPRSSPRSSPTTPSTSRRPSRNRAATARPNRRSMASSRSTIPRSASG